MLDSLLVGGLAGAHVVLAGDFTRQDIYRQREPSPVGQSSVPLVEEAAAAGRSRLETISRRIPDAATMTLTANVRQTPQLAAFVEQLLSDELYADYGRDDEEPHASPGEVHLYRTPQEQDALLEQTLATLWGEGWDPHEILILSPRRDSAAARATGKVADALQGRGTDGKTAWGTVHLYKGLEAPVVILTDVDGSTSGWEDLLYVGATRATERLVVFTSLDQVDERTPIDGRASLST